MFCKTVVVLCLVLALVSAHLSSCFDLLKNNQCENRFHRIGNSWLLKKWRSSKLAAPMLKVRKSHQLTKVLIEGLPDNPESKMTPVEIITRRGYPAEKYSVVTSDNYMLEIHRIPHGRGQLAGSNSYGRPILLQHGFIGSSADWLVGPSNRSLAFRLADSGFDVWLGNARGNTYSRKHKYLNSTEEAFWNFSWDEMGKFDIPAVMKFILAANGRDKLSYIGYSMGACVFFVAMIAHPELNSNIDTMIALGPAVSLAHIDNPVVRTLAPFVKYIEFLTRLLRVRNVLSNDVPESNDKLCLRNYLRAGICRKILFLITGHEPLRKSQYFDLNLLPVIDGHLPAGTSVRTAAHFAMNYNSGENFIPYDYGWLDNLRHYGRLRPPPYDLSKVTVPVYLFYGMSDHLVRPEDVAWLATKLPNLKESIKIDYDYYNHFDFLWATDNNRVIYNKIFSILTSSP